MIREAPTANRYVQEAENERQYQKHVNAIKNMKPSINTHAEIKNKDKKVRNPRVRIFNGQTALNNGNQQMATTGGPRKEKLINKNDKRPRSGMNFINLEINIENDNENDVFINKKPKNPSEADLISISESSSGLIDTPNKKKLNDIDNSNSPDKRDITDFDIFSMNSAKSQAEKEREDLTTNRYHPYIQSNSARTKVKTIKPEVQQQPLSAKKSRIPLSRQDNHTSGNNKNTQGLKKTTSTGSISNTAPPSSKPKIKVKPKEEKNNNNANTDDNDNSTTNNNVAFNAPKVSSARRKTKTDNNNHPHMNLMEKQQIQAQQRQQQRLLKQQQEKIERQERLEKLEKQKRRVSANPSSSQIPPSSPVSNKSSGNKSSRSPNIGSDSTVVNKKQQNENKKVKNENNDKKFFKTEISLSKTKKQNEKSFIDTDLDTNDNNDDSFLPCQPILAESTPKVTFGADMWDTSDDEDEDENESFIKDQSEENIDQIENKSSCSEAAVADTNNKSILSDIESDRDASREDFVCSDDFSSDNDF